jgi:hypothetical protein
MLQMAVYMGFKEIYLLGVDCNYASIIDENGKIQTNNLIKDHFFDDNKETEIFANVNNQVLSYKAAEKYCRENGIKIYNATRGGKLEVFERIDFNKIDFNTKKLRKIEGL